MSSGSGVWVFGKSMGKIVLLGEQVRNTVKHEDGISTLATEGHTLRLYDGYAQRCLTCGKDDLRRGETCDKIQEHNARMDGETA